MDLQMNANLPPKYTSGAQKIRVITERWVSEQLYCPCCGHFAMQKYENNRPAADFFCPQCEEQYELKSKAGPMGKKVMDGAYKTMIDRITSLSNPNFLFLQYEQIRLRVYSLILVPRCFLSPGLIEKRTPLSPAARRAGWTGCNILYQEIPSIGRIFLVEKGQPVSRDLVLNRVREVNSLSSGSIEARGWLLDTLRCIERIPKNRFTLEDVYQFVPELEKRHPQNHHVREKLRQQLQFLRNRGWLRFVGRGIYEKRNAP